MRRLPLLCCFVLGITRSLVTETKPSMTLNGGIQCQMGKRRVTKVTV